MKAIRLLLGKDIREHWLAFIALAGSSLLLTFLVLQRNTISALDMNSVAAVRLALISFLPVVAIVAADRLIVSEYLGKTRLFVEALPLGTALPLVLKYSIGLVYLCLLALACLGLCVIAAPAGDDIDRAFVELVSMKTVAVTALIWSIVFAASLCGRLRFLLLLGIGVAVYGLTVLPTFDEERLGPLALINSELFVFERDVIPWGDLAQTLLMAICFTALGFGLAFVSDGSLAERLAKPVGRRDYMAVVIAVLGFSLVYGSLKEDEEFTPYELSGETVLQADQPKISLQYELPEAREAGEKVLARTASLMNKLQHELGLERLPPFQIAHNVDLDREEHHLWSRESVGVIAAFADYDEIEHAFMDAVTIHGLFEYLTNDRAVFESRHWVLDGFSQWWASAQLEDDLKADYHAEMMVHAIKAKQLLPTTINLSASFDRIVDVAGSFAGEALSYSMLVYLNEQQGREVSLALAQEFLIEPVGHSFAASVRDRSPDYPARFERATGITWSDAHAGWSLWLFEQATQPAVAQRLALIPQVLGEATVESDDRGYLMVNGGYTELDDYVPVPGGTCVMRHTGITAFVEAVWLKFDERDESSCDIGDATHSASGNYAPGDRVYVALDYTHPGLRRSVRLRSQRLTVK